MSPNYYNYLKRSIAKVLGRFRPNFKLWLLLIFLFKNYGGKKVSLIESEHHLYISIAYLV